MVRNGARSVHRLDLAHRPNLVHPRAGAWSQPHVPAQALATCEQDWACDTGSDSMHTRLDPQLQPCTPDQAVGLGSFVAGEKWQRKMPQLPHYQISRPLGSPLSYIIWLCGLSTPAVENAVTVQAKTLFWLLRGCRGEQWAELTSLKKNMA